MLKKLILLLLFPLLFSCSAKKDLFVLLEDPDGGVGKIVVKTKGGEQAVTKANFYTVVTDETAPPEEAGKMEDEEIKSVFGDAIDALPLKPVSYILYFKSDTIKLKRKSYNLLPEIIDTINKRKSTDTSVVGHADRAGSEKYNYALSKKRAESVANLLIKKGVDPDILEITSHGEENPLVPTKDNVHEPKNRRVEITVR